MAGNNNNDKEKRGQSDNDKLGLVVVLPRDPEEEEEEENIITSVGWQPCGGRDGDASRWFAFPSRQKHYEPRSL